METKRRKGCLPMSNYLWAWNEISIYYLRFSNYSHICDIFANGEMTPLRAAPACDGNTNANLINISFQRLVVLSGEVFFFFFTGAAEFRGSPGMHIRSRRGSSASFSMHGWFTSALKGSGSSGPQHPACAGGKKVYLKRSLDSNEDCSLYRESEDVHLKTLKEIQPLVDAALLRDLTTLHP